MLKQRVALITGAASGIGRVTALKFAELGYQLVLADLNGAENSAVADAINNGGGKAIAVPTDVSKAADVQHLLQQTTKHYGRLDYAVNNAGIHIASPSLWETSEESFDQTIAVNLRGVFLSMKYELPIMLQNKDNPSIVNIASVAGVRGLKDSSAYCASKAGVMKLTEVAAIETRGKVRVNCLCPGSIKTPMVTQLLDAMGAPIPEPYAPFPGICPMDRLGEAEEVADTISMLCSDTARYIHGASIVIDGGMTSYIPLH